MPLFPFANTYSYIFVVIFGWEKDIVSSFVCKFNAVHCHVIVEKYPLELCWFNNLLQIKSESWEEKESVWSNFEDLEAIEEDCFSALLRFHENGTKSSCKIDGEKIEVE